MARSRLRMAQLWSTRAADVRHHIVERKDGGTDFGPGSAYAVDVVTRGKNCEGAAHEPPLPMTPA